jgi:hypothetical protein
VLISRAERRVPKVLGAKALAAGAKRMAAVESFIFISDD